MRSRIVVVVGLLIGANIDLVRAATPASKPTSRPTTRVAATTQANVEPKDPRARCAGRMRRLLLVCELYANERSPHLLPPDLATAFVAEDFEPEPDWVLCPNDRGVRPPKDWATLAPPDRVKWAIANMTYAYAGGGVDASRALELGVDREIIVLTEKITDHVNRGGGMNVGFADGHVEFVAKADLPAATARSDAARATLARKR